jgi:dynactin complex subunit
MNLRIEFQNQIGTVLYCGPLLHLSPSPSETYLGVEWDDPLRGKHNGSISSVQYFQAKHPTGGSLVKKSKASFGQSLLESL